MPTRPTHHTFRLPLIALAACSTLLAACGSATHTPTNGSGQAGGTPNAAQAQREILAFTDCMRSHGVTGLADPSPSALKGELAPSTAHSPAFQAAFPNCSHLLPFGGSRGTVDQTSAHKAAFLAFATCIRAHGFPSFPDPSVTGQLTHEMVAAAGIDLHQPAVLQAGDACVGESHGFITRAMVARFVAGR